MVGVSEATSKATCDATGRNGGKSGGGGGAKRGDGYDSGGGGDAEGGTGSVGVPGGAAGSSGGGGGGGNGSNGGGSGGSSRGATEAGGACVCRQPPQAHVAGHAAETPALKWAWSQNRSSDEHETAWPFMANEVLPGVSAAQASMHAPQEAGHSRLIWQP